METWVALLRGINVGGKHLLPMRQLVQYCELLNCQNVRTYIQSGNVVFQATKHTAKSIDRELAHTIYTQHGFSPQVLVLSKTAFQKKLSANPFADEEPKYVHLFFGLERITEPDLERLESLKAPSEQFAILRSDIYLFAPLGIGRSKLASRLGSCVKVESTARNMNTLLALTNILNAST